MAGDDWEYQVRHRAYELWNEAGRPDAKHLEFWNMAERELKKLGSNGSGSEAETNILGERPSDHPTSKGEN